LLGRGLPLPDAEGDLPVRLEAPLVRRRARLLRRVVHRVGVRARAVDHDHAREEVALARPTTSRSFLPPAASTESAGGFVSGLPGGDAAARRRRRLLRARVFWGAW